MKIDTRVGIGCYVCLLCALVASASVSAEKLDCSGSKKSKQQLSNEAIKPGDRPDRELVQTVRVDVISSKNPEFHGIETTVYNHSDHIGATGDHNGYSMYPLKSGEKVWVKYQGTHFLVPKGEAWELPYQGVYHFIAGTGKYKGIRGGGYYKGLITPDGLTEDFVCVGEY